MFKKLIFLLTTILIIPAISDAQVVNIGKKRANQGVMLYENSLKEAQKQNIAVQDEQNVAEGTGEEEVLEEEVPPPPTTITPEEIIAFETESKKSIRRSVKNKDDKDRERILGTMNWSNKTLKIQELMAGGMSYKDAKKTVEETIKLPKMNIKKDKDIEKYIYEKGKFITNEK